MKNILVTATTFPRWENDKEATFVKDLSLQYVKKNYNVSVLIPHCYGLKNKQVIDNLNVYTFKYAPVYFEKLAYGGMLQNIKRNYLILGLIPFFVLSEFVKALKVIKKDKIEVIHSHWIIPQGFVGAVIRKIKPIKHIVTIHAADIFLLNKLPFKKSILKLILKNSDGITCVSTHGRKTLLDMIPNKYHKEVESKIRLLPMGVNIESFKIKKTVDQIKKEKNIPPNKKVILFVGRLADKKGVTYLIDALQYLDDSFLLMIVGDGPLMNNLKDQTKLLHLDNKIRFEGYKTGNEKNEYFIIGDIFVSPSIVDTTGDTEGLPVVLLEALAACKSVIATNVGGIPDLIQDGYNGLLVSEKEPKQIAEKIKELSKNDKLRVALEKNAQLSSKNYSWEIIGKKYLEFIDSI